MSSYKPINKFELYHIGLVFLVLTLTPFIILCFFAQPSFVDDYCFTIKTLELGVTNAFLEWYKTWTGRYSLCFLMSINPLLIKSFFLYKVFYLIFIILIPLSIFFLIKKVSPNNSKAFYLNFTSLFTFLFFSELPSTNEGLYWMTGAMAYQLPNICLMLFLTLIIMLNNNQNGRTANFILAAILIVIIIGCNEISMTTLTGFISLLTSYNFFIRSNVKKKLAVLFIISLIASLFVILSPGNDVRSSLFPQAHQLPWAIGMTIIGLGYYLGKWLGITCLIILLSLFIINLEGKKVQLSPKIPPIISLLVLLTILATGFFVPAWSTGEMPNPRAINVLFFIYLLGIFYHIISIHQYVIEQYKTIEVSKIVAFITVFTVFFITFNPDKSNKNNIKTAYIDLLSGTAYNFNLIMNNSYKKGVLPKFDDKSTPASIYKKSENTELEYSECAQLYFNKYYNR